MWKVVALGNLGKSSLFGPACEEYVRRIRRYRPLELVEIKPIKGTDTPTILRKEAQLLQPHIAGVAQVVLLDEQGRSFTTTEWSGWLENRSELVFVLGSAWGLHPDLKATGYPTLALSQFTLPHELARVMLLEQLYRALTILAGHPYHHG